LDKRADNWYSSIVIVMDYYGFNTLNKKSIPMLSRLYSPFKKNSNLNYSSGLFGLSKNLVLGP
jgi:hypothetical protein